MWHTGARWSSCFRGSRVAAIRVASCAPTAQSPASTRPPRRTGRTGSATSFHPTSSHSRFRADSLARKSLAMLRSGSSLTSDTRQQHSSIAHARSDLVVGLYSGERLFYSRAASSKATWLTSFPNSYLYAAEPEPTIPVIGIGERYKLPVHCLILIIV